MLNDPINYIDPEGESARTADGGAGIPGGGGGAIGAGAGAAAAAGAAGMMCPREDENDKSEKCLNEYDRETRRCKSYTSTRVREGCYKNASERLGECLSGRQRSPQWP